MQNLRFTDFEYSVYCHHGNIDFAEVSILANFNRKPIAGNIDHCLNYLITGYKIEVWSLKNCFKTPKGLRKHLKVLKVEKGKVTEIIVSIFSC